MLSRLPCVSASPNTSQAPPIVQEQPKAAPPPRTTMVSGQVAPPPASRPTANIDLFGDDPPAMNASTPAPPRAASAAPATSRPPPPPKAEPAPPKPKPADSLLGFDFFGTTQAPPARPQSAAANVSGAPSRPDLKQSILSLYSKPAPVAASQPSPNPTSPASQQSSNFGSMNDAFSGLNFGGSAQVAKPAVFSNLASPPMPQQQQRSVANAALNTQQNSVLSGGSFFDTKPAPKPAQTTTATSRPAFTSATSGFGDFASAVSPGWGAPAAPAQTSSTNGMNDLFDFSAPAAPKAASVQQTSSASHMDSPFNISTATKPAQPVQSAVSNRSNVSSSISIDPWGGSSNAWASPAPTTTAARAPAATQVTAPRAQPSVPAASDGWGDFASSTGTAQVTADEDFGGWESSTAPAPVSAPMAAPAATQTGTFTSAAAFDNPWE